MKHTERWLTVSLIIIGLTILLLGIRMFRNYSAQVSQANATTENTGTDSTLEQDNLGSDIEAQPYYAICNTLNISEVVEMPEPLYCGGYKLEITGVDVTKENQNWILNKEFLVNEAEEFSEDWDILSEEQYIAVHLTLTPYEEYLPYVEEGVTSQFYLNAMNLRFFTEQQEFIEYHGEPMGLSASDGMEDKALYQVDLEYGVPRQLDIIFVDSQKVLTTEENPIIVLQFNPSGMEYGVAPDLRKGVVLDVPN